MKDEGKKIAKEIKIEDLGKLKQFVGKKSKLTSQRDQQNLIQSFLDEFGT